jgi:hypothetical protein
MGDNGQFLSAKAKIDSGDFKNGIAVINQQIRLMEAQFRANTAAMGDWSNESAGLEQRLATLSNQIEFQKEKVRALKGALDEARQAQGENSAAAVKAQEAYLKGVEALGKMQAELNRTQDALNGMAQESQQAAGAVDDLGNKEEETERKSYFLRDALGGLKSVAKGATDILLGLATAAIGVVTALAGMVVNSAKEADELGDLRDRTNLTTTELQQMGYAAEQVGVDLDTVISAQEKMEKTMASAGEQTADYNKKVQEQVNKTEAASDAYDVAAQKYGKNSNQAKKALEALNNEAAKVAELQAGPAAQAYEKLGVKVTDANGQLRDSQAVFADTIIALKGIQNQAERDALTMEIFGKSGQDLNALINNFDDFNQNKQEALDSGFIVTEKELSILEEFDAKLKTLKFSLDGVFKKMSAAFAPMFGPLIDQAQDYLGQLLGVIAGSGGDLGAMSQGIGGLLGKLIGDVASQAPQMLSAGFAVIQGLMDAIITQLPVLMPAVISILNSLATFLLDNIPTLLQAGITILLGLVQGISTSLPTLIPAVIQAILFIVDTLVQNIPMLTNAAFLLLTGLALGLYNALPVLYEYVPKILEGLKQAFLTGWEMIYTIGSDIFNQLMAPLREKIDEWGEFIGQVIGNIRKAVGAVGSTLNSIGESIVQGIWEGIQAAGDWLYDMIAELVGGMVDAAMAALGIKSPSKVFAEEVGEPSGEGIFVGMGNAMKAGTRQLKNDFASLPGELGGMNGFGGYGVATATGRTYNMTINATKVDEYALERYMARAEAAA